MINEFDLNFGKTSDNVRVVKFLKLYLMMMITLSKQCKLAFI